MFVNVPKHLARISDLAGEPGRGFALSGVLVVPPQTEEDLYRLVATDGKALMIVQGMSDEPDAITQETLENLGASGDMEPMLVHADSWDNAFKIRERDRKGGPAPVLIYPTEGRGGWVACGPQGMRVLGMEGRYPDYNSILPKRPPLASVHLGVRLLQRVLGAIASMQARGEEDRVTLLWYGPGQPVGLMARAQGRESIDCVVMPLT